MDNNFVLPPASKMHSNFNSAIKPNNYITHLRDKTPDGISSRITGLSRSQLGMRNNPQARSLLSQSMINNYKRNDANKMSITMYDSALKFNKEKDPLAELSKSHKKDNYRPVAKDVLAQTVKEGGFKQAWTRDGS